MKSLIEDIKETQHQIIGDGHIDVETRIRSIILLEKQIEKLIRADISASRARWNIIDQLEEQKRQR